MPSLPSEYKAVLNEHRARLARLADRRGASRIKSLYDEAYKEVTAKLHNLMRGQLGSSYSAHQHRVVLSQLQQGQVMLAKRMKGELGDLSKEAQTEAIRAFSKDVARLEKHFTGAAVEVPVDEAVKLRELVNKRAPQLDEMHREAIAKWGTNTFNKIHTELSRSLVMGESVEETIARIPVSAAKEWWQGERIVRTETAFAYNSAHHDSFVEAAQELTDLRMRWSEHVSDDGIPLDSRVADDSLALHGQVAHPGGYFTMPVDPDVEERFWGKRWMFPPNRPNDRAVLSPWRPGWGIPAWEFKGGRRVNL